MTLAPSPPDPSAAIREDPCAIREACSPTPQQGARLLQEARLWEQRAMHEDNVPAAMRAWSRCAANAWLAMGTTQAATGKEAAILSTQCADRFLVLALQQSHEWSAGPMRIDGVEIEVEFRGLSTNLGGPLMLTRAQDVPMDMLDGQRYAGPGFGVPLALLAPRCADRATCRLFPPEGIFRWATAWIENDPSRGKDSARLVIADPVQTGPLSVGGRRYALALDTSAFLAHGAGTSKLKRLGIWGLLGGDEVGKRAGVYLLEDYDPAKRPLVMIHGLGSSPLAWAKLSNAVWGDPRLRQRFQIWHVVYQTNAPLLVTRRRVKGYLDEAWRLLDVEGDDDARNGMVLVGHSLGGVVSRMLCVDSGEVLWNAAFTVPLQALEGSGDDLQVVDGVFHFEHYPGVSRAIFLAAPHRGSPGADAWFGRLMRTLVGRRASEMQSLKRIARDNPLAVREELRAAYQQADLNSITTLQASQPVRRAGETLMPAAGISYHVISGVLPHRFPETDGAVPLASTLLSGAESTLQVASGHDLYNNDEAIDEVLRILREDGRP
ncbi:MAG: alpha/beta hydrolase [Pseudoxanthomonas sp.]